MSEVRLEDLLRREPVRQDPSTIRATLQGRRVLRRVVPEYELIAVGAGGNGRVGAAAAGGAAGVAPAAVTLARPVTATNGRAGTDHERYGASGANGSAQRWPGCPGNDLPGSGLPPAGESRPTASRRRSGSPRRLP